MTIIGAFTGDKNGYTGTLHTLTLDIKLQLIPADGKSAKAPDFRVLRGALEVGAAWRRTAESGREYLAVTLDDPAFTQPIYANLIENDNGGARLLLWTRDKR
jgi:uncharacterized protein (DUF736 family)